LRPVTWQAEDGHPDFVCVVSAILAHRWDRWEFGVLVIPVNWMPSPPSTLRCWSHRSSAIDYFVGFWKKIDRASKDGALLCTYPAQGSSVS